MKQNIQFTKNLRSKYEYLQEAERKHKDKLYNPFLTEISKEKSKAGEDINKRIKRNTEGMTWDLGFKNDSERKRKALTRDKTAQKKTAF